MSQKNGKGKQTKGKKTAKAKAPAATDQSVLGSLPSTRPTRLARRREGEAEPAAATTAKPTPARRPRAVRTPAAAKPAPTRKPRVVDGPRPVRAGAPSLVRPRAEPPPTAAPPSSSGPPKGTELVTTAVQAAGELAQIGLTVGGQILKRAVGRLPKP